MKFRRNFVKFALILFCLFTAIAPIAWAWMVELTWQPVPGTYLTNGFFNADPMIIYHLNLYLNVFTSFFIVALVLMNIDKILGGKE